MAFLLSKFQELTAIPTPFILILPHTTFSTDQQLMQVLHQFGLDKVINQHPQGLDMQLGENGLGLSGGQKQLLLKQ